MCLPVVYYVRIKGMTFCHFLVFGYQLICLSATHNSVPVANTHSKKLPMTKAKRQCYIDKLLPPIHTS